MVATLVASNPTPDEAERAIALSSEQFAAAVYKQMKNQDGNLLICPISVQTVLALVQEGANGETSDEIGRALNFPADKSVVQRGVSSLMDTLLNSQGVTMDIANHVYVKTGYNIKPSFKEVATRLFRSGIENLNFSAKTEAANTINQWVEEKTRNKIKDLISPSMLTEDTRMVLVNALYFQGNWSHSFPGYATRKKDFYLNAQDSVKVPMMYQTENFLYGENAELDCKFLELPYQGGQYAMTIVLPNRRDGLADLEKNIEKVLAPQQLTNERVEVTMPKFTIETKIEFNDILKALGMRKAFEDGADFSDLLDSPEPLKISDVIQKNFINVTESGTEAASATAAVLVTKLAFLERKEPPKEFHVDHGAVFFITHKLMLKKTNLFVGRICKVA